MGDFRTLLLIETVKNQPIITGGRNVIFRALDRKSAHFKRACNSRPERVLKGLFSGFHSSDSGCVFECLMLRLCVTRKFVNACPRVK